MSKLVVTEIKAPDGSSLTIRRMLTRQHALYEYRKHYEQQLQAAKKALKTNPLDLDVRLLEGARNPQVFAEYPGSAKP